MDENMENTTPTPDNQPQPEPQAAQTPPEMQQTPSVEVDQSAKQWGMFCHLAAFAGFIGIPFGNILGPLILWLIKKDESAFIDNQGKESLNFQISVVICGLVLTPTVCFPPLFILLIIGLSIANIVFIILASLAANKGEAYQYPYCLRLVK